MTEKRDLPFNKFESNVHSQNGEDGVISEILRLLGKEAGYPGWCVEFGAWDGMHLSNTFALIEQGWNAVYIEGDAARFQDLLQTAQKQPRIVPLNAFVSSRPEDTDSLDRLLRSTKIPAEFELLSIDIDSYDLDIWESLAGYSPEIVIIEINSSVPPGILWRHSPKTNGNSFSSTLNVAKQKGYTLACHTGNLIFVKNSLARKLDMEPRFVTHPELLFQYDSPWLSGHLFDSSGPRRGILDRLVRKIRSLAADHLKI